MELWDFKNGDRNEIAIWAKRLSGRDRAALNQKLDLLQRLDCKQAIGLKLLGGPIKRTHILELHVGAEKALRPLLCRGPLLPLGEYTLLAAAETRDWKLYPSSALDRAIQNRERVSQDPTLRIKHERA